MTEMKPATLRAVADWLDGRYAEVTPALLHTIADGLEADQEPPCCPGCGGPVVTHFGVIHFLGDLDDEHPDPDLKGRGPHIEVIAAGGEDHCWRALAEWTVKHPLRLFESAEVLARTAVQS